MKNVDRTRIIVKDIIGSEKAVSSEKGEIVFIEIKKNLENNIFVELDFTGISLMTTAFLNAAIGQLYSQYSSDQLNKLLKPISITEEDEEMFIMVVSRAKEYFANKIEFENSLSNIIYGE